MAMLSNQVLRTLIESSSTIEEAKDVFERNRNLSTVQEKIAFLQGMFGQIEIIDKHSDDSDELTYNLMLHAIICQKFA